MTKPSDFILNTDYLPLAQINNYEFTATFPAETYEGGQSYDRDRDFNVQALRGAIDSVQISVNGADYVLGSRLLVPLDPTSIPLGPFFIITVYRLNQNTLRVRMHVFGSLPTFTVPQQTITIKVSTFIPPNVF